MSFFIKYCIESSFRPKRNEMERSGEISFNCIGFLHCGRNDSLSAKMSDFIFWITF